MWREGLSKLKYSDSRLFRQIEIGEFFDLLSVYSYYLWLIISVIKYNRKRATWPASREADKVLGVTVTSRFVI